MNSREWFLHYFTHNTERLIDIYAIDWVYTLVSKKISGFNCRVCLPPKDNNNEDHPKRDKIRRHEIAAHIASEDHTDNLFNYHKFFTSQNKWEEKRERKNSDYNEGELAEKILSEVLPIN